MSKVSNTSNPLINVNFTDSTNNVAPIDTMDIVGVVVDTCWGAPDSFRVLDRAGWNAFANPLKQGVVNYSYAAVERVFDAGAQYVEVFRPTGNNKYMVFSVTGHTTTEGTDDEEATTTPAAIEFAVMSAAELATAQKKVGAGLAGVISLRYPGGFNCELQLAPLAGRKIEGAMLNELALIVDGTVVETHTISFDRFTMNGQSFFYADVLNAQSQYLMASDNEEGIGFEVEGDAISVEATETGYKRIAGDDTDTDAEAEAKADYSEYYNNFEDRSQSQATILIPTVSPLSSGYVATCTAMVNAVDKRKDACCLTGVAPSVFNADGTKAIEAIAAFVQSISTKSVMFWGAIAAWEQYTVRNKTFQTDGTASWAGAMASVAQQTNNRNQLPSYIAYGRTNAVLYNTLKFKDVVDLMDTYGIGSIYSAAQGNYIFNVRSQYFPQSSYFGKLNVGRITAAILHWMLPDVEGVIHTEVTSDALQRLQFQDAENNKLGQMIARGELKAESYVDIGNEINTDALTNGGECLNIEVHAWYKKLTEEVRISIIATDTTTTVAVSEGE